jgi:predicted Zn-dependent peptidase
MSTQRPRRTRLNGLAMLALLPALLGADCAQRSQGPPPVGATPDGAPPLFAQVEEFRLDNGMLFLLLPRHDVPSIAARILVKVGNVDNPPGDSGLAHMFEHMAFKGTDVMGARDAAAEAAVLDTIAAVGDQLRTALKADPPDSARVTLLPALLAELESRAAAYAEPMAFFQLYDRFAYDYNARTGQDFTIYEATVPANALEAWMLIESERLQHTVFREFYSELGVVQDERRMRRNDSPEGTAWETMQTLAYGDHPYRNPTIGWEDDLAALSPNLARAFYATYYVPGNMVAALVGDFDPVRARQLIVDYFGDIPPGPQPPGIPMEVAAPTAQRRAVHRQGEERQLLMSFPGLPPTSPEQATARMLGDLLSRDRTSRLDRRLDLETGVARNVRLYAGAGLQRAPGMFVITVDIMPEHSNEEAEAIVWEELVRMQEEPAPAAKLAEISSADRKNFTFSLQRNASLADRLARAQAVHGDWREIYRDAADYAAVTPEAVQALAQRLFVPERATIVYLEPEAPIAEQGGQP